jgi:predicted ester cyclase
MARGTHQGAFMGIPPTGKAISFEVFEIVRFREDGKAVERWAMIDMVGLLRQLGMKQIP